MLAAYFYFHNTSRCFECKGNMCTYSKAHITYGYIYILQNLSSPIPCVVTNHIWVLCNYCIWDLEFGTMHISFKFLFFVPKAKSSQQYLKGLIRHIIWSAEVLTEEDNSHIKWILLSLMFRVSSCQHLISKATPCDCYSAYM